MSPRPTPLVVVFLSLFGILLSSLHAHAQGEISIEQPAYTPLMHGSTVSFGETVSGPVNITFTLRNVGTATLGNISVSKGGTHGDDFNLVSSPPTTLAAGNSVAFSVRFRPSALGTRSALLRIFSDDEDEGAVDIFLTGTGTASPFQPEIEVRNAATGANLSQGTSLNIGSAQVSTPGSAQGFLIRNIGRDVLSGLGVRFTQSVEGEYDITVPLVVETLAPGEEAPFSIRFSPSEVGTRPAIMHIDSNDADERPLNINLTGTGIHRLLRIEAGTDNTVIPKLGTYDFGAFPNGTNTQRTLRFRNAGLNILTVTRAEISGGQSFSFTPMYGLSGQVIASGKAFDFPITFRAQGSGLRSTTLRLHSDDALNTPYEITLTGTSLQGQLAVDEPVGTTMSNGQGRNFASVPRLASASITFTLRNVGNGPMTLQASRTGSTYFAVTQAPVSPLAVATSTNVTVTYTPQLGGGPHQATLLIDHDGVSPDPFVIPLTGMGDVSMVSIDNPHLHANQGATTVLVPLSRTNTALPAMVKLSTYQESAATPGQPFQPAIAGLDYVAQTGTEVYFEVGQTTRTIPVQLLPRAAMEKKNLHFKVLLEEPGMGTDIPSSSSFAFVRILGKDGIPPTLTLATPAAGNVAGESPYLVTGRAGDASGIRRVEVRLNGGEPVVVAPSGIPLSTPVPFAAAISPEEGANVVTVTAYDMRENAATVTRSFTFIRRYRLDIEMANSYGQAFDAGTLAITATPAAGAPPFVLPAPEWPRRRSIVAPGTLVRVVVTPIKNYAVLLWSRGPDDGEPGTPNTYLNGTGHVYEFTMPPWDTHVQVRLTPSPFFPPEGSTNTLHWRLPPDPAVMPGAGSFASLSGTITPAGSFTGKLLTSGQSIPVVARLNGHAEAVFTVGRNLSYSLPFPGGQLMMHKHNGDAMPEAAIGLQDGGNHQWIPGRWGKYSSRNKVPQSLLNPNKTHGYYTLHLTPDGGTRSLPTDHPYPKAPGYASVTLTNLGQVTLAGLLADGSTLTANSTLVAGFDGQEADVAPIFVQLPTPGATTKTAVLTGDLEFDPYTPYVPSLSGIVRWFRPASTNPKVLLYPQGWPRGLDLRIHGTRYPGTYDLQTLLMLGSYTPGLGNASLSFTGGSLTGDVTKSSFALNKNAIIKVAPGDASYTLSIAPTTGLFSGTFTPNWSAPAAAKPVFKGIIIQNVVRGTSTARGFFLNNSKIPSTDGSGAVILGAPPQN